MKSYHSMFVHLGGSSRSQAGSKIPFFASYTYQVKVYYVQKTEEEVKGHEEGEQELVDAMKFLVGN